MSEINILTQDAIALVTGASSGIGATIACALAAKGAYVICASRNLDELKSLSSKMNGRGYPIDLDVTETESVSTLLDRLPKELHDIDILVTSAGHDIGGRQRFDKGKVQDWINIIETNVNGMIRVCHKIIPGMLSRHRGHVVTLGSVNGLRTYPGGSIYCASKFAVRAFSEALRADYKNTPLRITEILPGLVRTGFAANRWHGDEVAAEAWYDNAPQALEAEDVAKCVVFALELPPNVMVSQLVVVPTEEM